MTECERLIKEGLFTEDFFKEEIRNDCLVDTNRKKIWAIEIDMLLKLAEVCEKHDIQWFAIAGTLLGAVRHKGFIPWDDDIDIIMTRENYDKFIQLGNEFKEPYFLQTPYTDSKAAWTIARIRNINTTGINHYYMYGSMCQGMWLDIIPLDKYNPKTGKEIFNKIDELNSYQSAYMKLPGAELSQKSRKLLYDYPELSPLTAYDKVHELATQKDEPETDKMAIFVTTIAPLEVQIYQREWFNEAIDMEFEGFKIKIPKAYHEILTARYGDYMSFPPLETRKLVHYNNFMDPDIPYKEYLKSKGIII